MICDIEALVENLLRGRVSTRCSKTLIYTPIHDRIRAYIHTYMHTYMHTHIQTYTHACIHTCRLLYTIRAHRDTNFVAAPPSPQTHRYRSVSLTLCLSVCLSVCFSCLLSGTRSRRNSCSGWFRIGCREIKRESGVRLGFFV